MEPEALIKLGIAAVVILAILFFLRRASRNSQTSAISARERLGMVEDDETQGKRRERKRPRPGQEGKPTGKPAKREPEPELPEVEVDAEAAAAYKAGLQKTRGGFVAKLGKIFGKKKIDAQTLEELEEVLFTADIGPRAADLWLQLTHPDDREQAVSSGERHLSGLTDFIETELRLKHKDGHWVLT